VTLEDEGLAALARYRRLARGVRLVREWRDPPRVEVDYPSRYRARCGRYEVLSIALLDPARIRIAPGRRSWQRYEAPGISGGLTLMAREED